MYRLVLQICLIRLDICISIGLLRNLDARMHKTMIFKVPYSIFLVADQYSDTRCNKQLSLIYILIFTLSQKYQYFLKSRDIYVLAASQTHTLLNLSEARTSAKYCDNLVEPLTNAEETLKFLHHTKTFGVLIKEMQYIITIFSDFYKTCKTKHNHMYIQS